MRTVVVVAAIRPWAVTAVSVLAVAVPMWRISTVSTRLVRTVLGEHVLDGGRIHPSSVVEGLFLEGSLGKPILVKVEGLRLIFNFNGWGWPRNF